MYNRRFSPNMIKIYKLCPKKYCYQYIEHLSMPKSSVIFEKGKKVHALANYHLQGVKIDRIESALTQEEKYIWETLKQNPFYNMDYFKSEFDLSIKIGKDYWIGGRIDAIVNNGDDYYILDYKTGEIPQNPELDPQTMIYLLCVNKYLKRYNKLHFVYIDLKNRTNHVIEFNEKLKEQYEADLSKICEKISSDTLYNQNTLSCKYCEYNKICQV